jgi:hypothetical protein
MEYLYLASICFIRKENAMRRIFMVLAMTLLLAACGSSSSSADYATGSDSGYEMAPAMPETVNSGAMSKDASVSMPGSSGTGSTDPLKPGERLVVRDASLVLQVSDVNAVDQQLRAMVNGQKGFVLSSSSSGSDQDFVVYLTFKIPSDQLDATITAAEKTAHKVLSRSMSGSDVTSEYVDLTGRLTSLTAARERLLELLKKADKVEDAVAVNTALTDVQSQLEQITGQMRYLRENAALSSLTIELRPIPTTPIVNPEGWQPGEDARAALRSLLDFAQGLGSFLISAVIWTPVWVPLFFLGRYLRRRWLAGRTPPPTPPAA